MTKDEAIKTIEVIKCEAEWEYPLSWQLALDMAIDALKCSEKPNSSDLISRRKAEDKLKRVVNEMEGIFANIREKNCDDSVCGLCEYDADHGLDGYANECPGFEMDNCFKLNEKYRKEWLDIEY